MDFDDLSFEEQKEYYEKARYLIDNNYIDETELDTLAKRIYEKNKCEIDF